jgi:hypothetical protein
MNDPTCEFREKLLQAEQATPALKEKYSKEIQTMLEKKITGLGRFISLAAAISGLAFTVLFGALAIFSPVDFPLLARLGFGAGALFGIGWFILGIRIFSRGSLNLKTDTGIYAGLAWGISLIIVITCMVSAPDNLVGLRSILCGLVFLVMGAMFVIRHVVEISELKTREKLLEIEYRLAELTESLKLEKK